MCRPSIWLPRGWGGGVGNMNPSETSRESLSTCIFKSQRDQALPGSHTPYRFVSISKGFILS